MRNLAQTEAPIELELDQHDDAPIGECTHCGALYFDEDEHEYHKEAECIGGYDRFARQPVCLGYGR